MRAKLLRAEEPLRQYRWSSFGDYLKPPASRPAWLRVDRLFGEMRIPRDSVAGRRGFERMVEERKIQEEDEEFKAVRRGWCLGEERFKQELLGGAEGPLTSRHHAKYALMHENHLDAR